MASNIVLADLKTLYINGKQVKRLNVQGKQVKMSYNISFNNNMSNYYYIAGQGGTATSASAPVQVVPAGSAIGTLPSIGPLTYTLNGYTYSVSVTGWYTESSLTHQVTTSWVPTGDATLYAKWGMTGNTNILNGATSTGTVTFTIPKFAGSVYWYCSTNGGSRSAREETASSGDIDVAMCAPGATNATNSKTFTSVGGSSCSVAQYSCTVGGTSASVTQPGAGGSWHWSTTWRDITTRNTNTGVWSINSSGTKTSGNYKVVFTKSGANIVANCYYANSLKKSVNTFAITVKEGNSGYTFTTYSKDSTWGTFASGTNGAAGAYGVAWSYSSSVQKFSITAASGAATYSRTCRVQP